MIHIVRLGWIVRSSPTVVVFDVVVSATAPQPSAPPAQPSSKDEVKT